MESHRKLVLLVTSAIFPRKAYIVVFILYSIHPNFTVSMEFTMSIRNLSILHGKQSKITELLVGHRQSFSWNEYSFRKNSKISWRNPVNKKEIFCSVCFVWKWAKKSYWTVRNMWYIVHYIYVLCTKWLHGRSSKFLN